MTFVQAPSFDNGKPFAIHGLQNEIERMDSTFEIRRVADVKIEACFSKSAATFSCFFAASVSKVNVHPASEKVQLVPFAFAMANEYELHGRVGHVSHHLSCWFLRGEQKKDSCKQTNVFLNAEMRFINYTLIGLNFTSSPVEGALEEMGEADGRSSFYVFFRKTPFNRRYYLNF